MSPIFCFYNQTRPTLPEKSFLPSTHRIIKNKANSQQPI